MLSCIAVVLVFAAPAIAGNAPARPNILWISCEDISPQLGCYGDPQAVTPNLDRLAKESTRFTHAFSCHGVCAPSRTGIITGMYPIALGANHMRSKVNLPDHVKLFPQYLREVGYYCTNNSKTDYNVVWNQKVTWDESSGKAHWKNRGSPVPLIVRIPERYRDLAGAGDPGSVDERMVSLIDLGPTVINLAGIETPGHKHGRSFLGSSGGAGRAFIFGARDRLEELYDLNADPAVRWWQVTLAARAERPIARMAVLAAESKHSHPALRIAAAGDGEYVKRLMIHATGP